MTCPACGAPRSLDGHELSLGVSAHRCTACGGEWIRRESYANWHGRHLPDAPPALDAEPIPDADTPALRRCPDCARILARYRVGHGAAFVIERCRECNGTWFDRDEWQALVQLGLARELPHVFSDEWQHAIRQEEQRAATQRMFEERLGVEEMTKAAEVREWIMNHPQRNVLLAFMELLPTSPPRAV